MKFETSPTFDSDVRRLKPEHAVEFRKVMREKFVPARDAVATYPAATWPTSLRVKSIRAAAGALEMTWPFASPDGRATFELVTVEDEMRVRWRRVGDHAVCKDP
ncbi:hypothetical protein ACHAAC_16830 [Aeromicrobium sp. CF4.19]|uniref:hypothetical protein n=1 Tax=Aeromicrobium sp. CF4.19 TaxID=3373082 RepID=UPI003EE80CE3